MKIPMQDLVALRFTVVLCVSLALGGCLAPQPSGSLADQFPESTMTLAEVDVSMRQITYQVGHAVQSNAGSAYREASNSRDRAGAAVFALRASGELNRATISGYPMATLVDVWALTVQLAEHFRVFPESLSGHGHELIKTFSALAEECKVLAGKATGSAAALQFASQIDTWARENPIGADFSRASVAPLLAIAKVQPERGIGDISETVGDGLIRVSDRIEVLQSQLPTILAWQLIALFETRVSGIEAGFGEELQSVGASIEPAVARQIEQVFVAVREERIAIMGGLDQQRILILDHVEDQRSQFEAAVEAMRVASFEDLEAQLAELMETVDGLTERGFERFDVQRVATIADVDGMVDEVLTGVDTQRGLAVGEIDAIMNSVVEKALGRVFEFVVKVGVAAMIALFVLVIFVRVLWRG